MEPICVETLRKAMNGTTKAVEKKISEAMPDKFGLILDGWTHGSEHFLAVFAVYEVESKPQYPLLSMAPLVNEPEDDHSAATHRVFLENMLERDFGKSLDDCLFVVGDNCSVNRRLATLMGVPLVGCASHRLNLAVQEYMREHEDNLAVIQALMVKLKTLRQSAKLRCVLCSTLLHLCDFY